MKMTTKLAAAASFAHLLGLRPGASVEDDETEEQKERDAKLAEWRARGEEDENRRQRDDESDEDYAKRMEDLDEEEAKRAEGGDSTGNGEDDEDEKAKAARGAERARCAAIIAHGVKEGCVRQAGVFAFDTDLSAAAAIAAINAGRLDGGAQRGGLAGRMSAVATPNPGAGGGQSADPSSPKAVADRVIAAAKKARGEA